jgi:ribosomal protein S18 acetylase RimI-like enzyme
MSISISPINFNFEPHREIIMRLCNRNNFHKEDVYVQIYRDFPPVFKKMVIDLKGIKEYNTDIENLFLGLESSGYFITIEEDCKKKVVGFVIYDIEQATQKSYLLFILIDKKYQNSGFGTKLVYKYIQDIEEKKILCATVKIENEMVGNFYKKFGFDNHSNLMESEIGDYELLYYIPKPALQALNIIKQLTNKFDGRKVKTI